MGLFNSEKNFPKEKYEKELAEIFKKIDKCKSEGDNVGISWSYQMASKLAEDFGDLKKSIDYALQAIEYSLKENRFFNVGWLYKQISALAERDNDLNSAAGFAAKSAEYFLKANSGYAAQWSYHLAANLSTQNKDYYSAIKYFKKVNDIERDPEIEQQIEQLKKNIPHPIIDVHTDKMEIEEGDEIEFKLYVENNGREYLKNIGLVGENNQVLETIKLLKPKETQTFVYKTTGKVGVLRPKFKRVVWEDPYGKPIEKKFPYFGIRVKPKVVIKASVNPSLRLNRSSDFVILIKNLSSSNLKNIKYFVKFPSDLKAKKEGENKINTIKPGDEQGIVYRLTPKTVGKTTLNNIIIGYTDDYGIEYETKIAPIVLDETLTEPEITETNKDVFKKIDERKKSINFEPNPMLEEDYIKMTNTYFSKETGYTLNKIEVSEVSEHVLEGCSSLALIGSHSHQDEILYLFSGKKLDATYLLTVAVKKDGDLVNVLYKIYSDKEEGLENMLEKISNSIEYTITITSSAKTVEKIEVNEVINIIDSIVQRSKIGQDIVKDKKVTVRDSVLRKTEI